MKHTKEDGVTLANVTIMNMKSFATFCLVVSIVASIQAQIEDRALHTLVPCR